MDRTAQLAVLDRVMAHRASGNTTDLAPEVYANPVSTYTDPDRYEAEVDRLFRGVPVVACLTTDVAGLGDHVTLSITDVPILVARGEDGSLRAFRNVCRHRGVCVAEGRGVGARSFTCPFHGWTYGLDGRLLNATDAGFGGIDHTELGLVEVACGEAAGIVFVHVDGTPGTLDADAWLGELGVELAPFGLGEFHHYRTRTSNRAMNWKLMADTFCEQYHVRYLHHGSLASTIQSDSSLYDAYGVHGRMITPTWSISELDDRPREQWRIFPHLILNYMLVPNTVMLVQEDFVELFRFLPDGPDSTTSVATLYTREPLVPDETPRLSNAFDGLLGIIDTEDYLMCEQAQRGFGSGAQEHIVFGRNEPGLIHYHRSVEALLAHGDPA